MDYKLAWKIQRPIGNPFIPQSGSVRLTPFPAIDYVNPGCQGKLYQFYVPVHYNSNAHIIKKKVENVGLSLEGKGLSEVVDADKPNETISNPIDDPIIFNESKKLKLGEEVQNNFLHPKPIETGKLKFYESEKVLHKSVKKPIKVVKSQKTVKVDNKSIKHKFFII